MRAEWELVLVLVTAFVQLPRLVVGRLHVVTCGSVLKLNNVAHKVRLHSHDVKYGSGSGQQSVTGVADKEDVNSHWEVKGATAKKFCKRGEPVQCGQQVRLQHLTTSRNLHSHHFSSPLSNKQEVSAFGEEGDGDTGDVWAVVCDDDVWKRDESIMFKHVDTGVFLGASGHSFGRPIHGQMEIVGLSMPDTSAKWLAAEGIFIHPSDFDPKKQREDRHDEL
jgi:dolichyl-phosphate-mannose--protein O-mannosyl transferase